MIFDKKKTWCKFNMWAREAWYFDVKWWFKCLVLHLIGTMWYRCLGNRKLALWNCPEGYCQILQLFLSKTSQENHIRSFHLCSKPPAPPFLLSFCISCFCSIFITLLYLIKLSFTEQDALAAATIDHTRKKKRMIGWLETCCKEWSIIELNEGRFHTDKGKIVLCRVISAIRYINLFFYVFKIKDSMCEWLLHLITLLVYGLLEEQHHIYTVYRDVCIPIELKSFTSCFMLLFNH